MTLAAPAFGKATFYPAKFAGDSLTVSTTSKKGKKGEKGGRKGGTVTNGTVECNTLAFKGKGALLQVECIAPT